MHMLNSRYLKTKLLLAFLLATSISAQCTDGIAHTGVVCDITNAKIYTDKNDFCDNSGMNISALLDYCKISACETCNEETRACRFEIETTESDLLLKTYNAETVNPNINPSQGRCVVTSGENCYRSAVNDAIYTSRYVENANQIQVDDPLCCKYECYDNFTINAGSCGSNSVYYTDLTVFCEAYCNNRTLTLTACGQPGCGVDQGCPDPCLTETQEPPFCSNTYVYYEDKATFCADKANGTVASTIDCLPNNCSTTGCAKLGCAAATETYQLASICLTTMFNGAYFYETVEDYCTAKVNNNDTNYEITNYIQCDGNACIDSTDCCEGRCKTEEYFVSCTTTDFKLVTEQQFCEHRCANESDMSLLTCSDANGRVDCLNCDFFECKNNIQTVNGYNTVCGTNDTFYANVDSYCTAFSANYDTSYTLCNGGACANDNACCYTNCINRETADYAAQCNTSNYVYHKTVEEYCTSYCNNSRTYNTYMVNAAIATELQCCEGGCNDKDDYVDVCIISLRQMVYGQAEYCALECSNPAISASVDNCNGAGCTQQNCNSKYCFENLADHSICDIKNDFTYYATKEDYCNSATVNINDLLDFCKIASCDICTSDLSNCPALIDTIENDFLVKYYSALSVKPDINPYEGKCKITEGEYCYRMAEPDQYIQRYNDPVGQEIVQDADPECCLFECYDRFTINDGACGSDGNYYTALPLFCALYCEDRTLNLTQCGEAGCGMDQGCPDPCLKQTEEPPFCSNTYVYYEDKEVFCTDKANGTVASTIDCLPNNCSTTGCAKLGCAAATETYQLASICLTTMFNGAYFYETVEDYCTAKVNNNDTNYEITNYIQCDGNACIDSTDCCEGRCKTEEYFVSCTTTDFKLVTEQQFCEHRCANESDMSLLTCSDANGRVDCLNCDFFECKNNIQTVNGYNTVCGTNDTFYADVDSYCTAFSANYDTSYTLCDGDACVNDNVCCYANCIDRETADYVAQCNTSNYVFHETVEEYCTSYCNNSRTYNTYMINAVIATREQCCEGDHASYNFPVCASNGNTYTSAQTFCVDKILDDTITILDINNSAFPVCGSDYELYTDLSSYCSATTGPDNVTTLDICGTETCTKFICCGAECQNEPTNPVVVLFDDDSLQSYRNECIATCVNPGANIVKSCTDETEDACKFAYCEEASYCGDNEEHEYFEYVCGNDGVLYSNSCMAGCNNKTVVEECPKKCNDGSWRLKRCEYECLITFNEL